MRILITGGTGSFGKAFVEKVKKLHQVTVYSRDELKQSEMNCEKILGDVRDFERLNQAMKGFDVVVHAAALKQIPSCENNPMEVIKTNILGSQNVIEAAKRNGVKALALSSDKAVAPVNVYGATKLCMERMFVKAGFSCVRYGNVVKSRGSVIPLFLKQREHGFVTVTDPKMTRFWVTLEEAVDFVFKSLDVMLGGEVFVKKSKSMKITDLVKVLAPDCEVRFTGIRPAEKLHEMLIGKDEAEIIEFPTHYTILPQDHPLIDTAIWRQSLLPRGFEYSSEKVVSVEELRVLLKEMHD